MNGTHTYTPPKQNKGQAWAWQIEHSAFTKPWGPSSAPCKLGAVSMDSRHHHTTEWKAVTAGPTWTAASSKPKSCFCVITCWHSCSVSGTQAFWKPTFVEGRQGSGGPDSRALPSYIAAPGLKTAAEGRVTSHLSLALDLWSLPLRALPAPGQAPLCSPVEEAGCVFAGPFHLLASGPPLPPPGLIKVFS